MFKRLSLIFCAIAGVLSGNAKLNKLMPIDIQRYTGVYYLTEDQKQYLADWLQENMNQPASTSENESQKELYLSENIEGGKFIRLSDNSLWEVDPIDLSRSKIWLFPFPVQIRKNGRQDFPYTITNMNTGSKVDVRKMGGG